LATAATGWQADLAAGASSLLDSDPSNIDNHRLTGADSPD